MDRTETFALALLGTAALLLAAALFMEHVLHLDPCPLCMMQRIWVGIVGLIACVGFVHGSAHRRYPVGGIVAAVVGAGFSLRQLYLQHLPADQVPSCGPDLGYMLDVFPAADVLKAMTFGTGNCAEVTFTLLGVSIAGWTLVGFIVMVALALLQIRSRA
jgi:disulfide bond formation protein DsbB